MTRKIAAFAPSPAFRSPVAKVKTLFKRKPTAQATPAPAAAAEPASHSAPLPEPIAASTEPEAPPKPAIDTKAQVVVLCYHRLEGKAGGALSIEPALFAEHMQKIKDSGATVISMQDFLAWRRGEKSIPAKSILITLDDGYVSECDVGVPILKKYGFPATFFIYTNYVNTGGKSMTWAQLTELRDAGFEIGCHTVSHQDLRHKPAKWPGDYESWLKDELERSKKIIEDNLGVHCATFAYPLGFHNEKVHEAVKAAGYEAAFTVYGARLGHTTNPLTFGRYDVTAKMPGNQDVFTVAVTFTGMAAPSGPPVMAQDAAASMVTQPMNNEVITDSTPTIKANLSTMGALDPGTVVMRISGFGLVPAQFDPVSKTISYTPPQELKPGTFTVIIGAKSGGRPVETRWNFTYSPTGAAAAAESPLPPRAEPTAAPVAKPPKKKK